MANNPEQELAAEEKRGRGRTPGFRMSAEHRDKISKSNILNRLISHVEGNVEMSATQVSAALGLLKKCLPDLQSVTVSGDDDADPVRTITTIERRIVYPRN